MTVLTFKKNIDGKEVGFFVIKNKHGIEVSFINYGQRLISLYVPDRDGNMKNIVLGFSNLEDYINSKEPYFGATIGSYANRIAKGRFQIDGEDFKLAINNGENHLHGGPKGFITLFGLRIKLVLIFFSIRSYRIFLKNFIIG